VTPVYLRSLIDLIILSNCKIIGNTHCNNKYNLFRYPEPRRNRRHFYLVNIILGLYLRFYTFFCNYKRRILNMAFLMKWKNIKL